MFQAVVLDRGSGELSESRFEPSRERLNDWAIEWQRKLAAVAIEATTGWRWVTRELQGHGFEVHLVETGSGERATRAPTTAEDRLARRALARAAAR